MADLTAEANQERVYGGCEGPDAMYVKLISSDGHEFIVKREHALTSGTIKAMLSGPRQFAENETNEVNFREIPTKLPQVNQDVTRTEQETTKVTEAAQTTLLEPKSGENDETNAGKTSLDYNKTESIGIKLEPKTVDCNKLSKESTSKIQTQADYGKTNTSDKYLEVDNISDLEVAEHCQINRLIKLSEESNSISMKSESFSPRPQTFQKKKEYKLYMVPRKYMTPTDDVWKNDICPRKYLPKLIDVNIDTSGFKCIKRIYEKEPLSATTSAPHVQKNLRPNDQPFVSDEQSVRKPPEQVPWQSLSSSSKCMNVDTQKSMENVSEKRESYGFLGFSNNKAGETQENSFNENEEPPLKKFTPWEKTRCLNIDTQKSMENVPEKRESYWFLGFSNNKAGETQDNSFKENEEPPLKKFTPWENTGVILGHSFKQNRYSPDVFRSSKKMRPIVNPTKAQAKADRELARQIHRELNRPSLIRSSLPRSDPKEWF